MNLLRTILGRNKFLVLVKAENLEDKPDSIHLEPRIYSIKTRTRVNAIEKRAFKNYKRSEAVFYRFQVFSEKEYTEIAKKSLTETTM